jgi:hypothetical protein
VGIVVFERMNLHALREGLQMAAQEQMDANAVDKFVCEKIAKNFPDPTSAMNFLPTIKNRIAAYQRRKKNARSEDSSSRIN